MKLNPFTQKPEDPLRMELDAQRGISREDIAGRSSGVDEELLLQQQRERAELTKWQQDMSEDIQLMVHRLKNEVLNAEGEWSALLESDPMCSDECIQRIVAMLEPSTSKNLMMSKYDKEQILSALLELTNAVTLHVISNRERYNIKMSDLTPLMQIFKTAATPTYFRALGANEKEYLRGIRKDTYLHTEGDVIQKKKGLFGM